MSPQLVVVVHVLTVFWLVAGVVGRDTCHAHAGRTQDLATLQTLTGLASVFERTMVRPATFAVLVTGLLAAWLRGWPIFQLPRGGGGAWVPVALLVYASIIPVIAWVFIPKGRVYRAALEEATRLDRVTPELTSAVNDRAVGLARLYELAMVVVLAWLMIAKPF